MYGGQINQTLNQIGEILKMDHGYGKKRRELKERRGWRIHGWVCISMLDLLSITMIKAPV